MIRFICDFCTKQYDAKVSMQGIRYQEELPDGAKEQVVTERDTDPCIECTRKSEAAATEALNQIKAIHTPAQVAPPTNGQ